MKKILLFIVFIIQIPPTFALTDQEQTLLHRVHRELLAIERLLPTAEQATDKTQRHQFNYDQLRTDIHAVKRGIDDAVNQQRREPRSLPAIHGVY